MSAPPNPLIPLAYQDVTLKAPVPDATVVERKLQALGARLVGIDRQVDRYYQVPQGKLKWRQGTIENLITHYERKVVAGGEQTIVYRYDVHPDEQAIAALQQSHVEIGIIEKERSIYWIDHVKIHLDKLSSGEMFLEIEAIDRSNTVPMEVLLNQCRHIQNQLGIPDRDLIKTGYYSV